MATDAYQTGNDGKANFDHIYNQPDPRAYFSALKPFNYIIPGQAKPVFETVVEAISERQQENKTKIIDVGCSYGINGALLKYDFTMQDLYRHYCEPEINDMTCVDCLQRDHEWLKSQDENENLTIIGLDISEEAVQYGIEAGFLDNGIVADLEEGTLTPEIENKIEEADLIISTGCVGYVTEKTFSRLLKIFEKDSFPWIASFVLRMFPYDSIAQIFRGKGLGTEKLIEPTFVQRSFIDAKEKEHVIQQLEAQGVDPVGHETGGNYLANFYLSRHEAEIQRLPLEEIMKNHISSDPKALILEPEYIS